MLRIADVQVSDAVLQNFKNQKIPIPRRIVPMIYTGLQKAPVKLDFQRVGIKNFFRCLRRAGKEGNGSRKTVFYGYERNVYRFYKYRLPS